MPASAASTLICKAVEGGDTPQATALLPQVPVKRAKRGLIQHIADYWMMLCQWQVAVFMLHASTSRPQRLRPDPAMIVP